MFDSFNPKDCLRFWLKRKRKKEQNSIWKVMAISPSNFLEGLRGLDDNSQQRHKYINQVNPSLESATEFATVMLV